MMNEQAQDSLREHVSEHKSLFLQMVQEYKFAESINELVEKNFKDVSHKRQLRIQLPRLINGYFFPEDALKANNFSDEKIRELILAYFEIIKNIFNDQEFINIVPNLVGEDERSITYHLQNEIHLRVLKGMSSNVALASIFAMCLTDNNDREDSFLLGDLSHVLVIKDEKEKSQAKRWTELHREIRINLYSKGLQNETTAKAVYDYLASDKVKEEDVRKLLEDDDIRVGILSSMPSGLQDHDFFKKYKVSWPSALGKNFSYKRMFAFILLGLVAAYFLPITLASFAATVAVKAVIGLAIAFVANKVVDKFFGSSAANPVAPESAPVQAPVQPQASKATTSAAPSKTYRCDSPRP